MALISAGGTGGKIAKEICDVLGLKKYEVSLKEKVEDSGE